MNRVAHVAESVEAQMLKIRRIDCPICGCGVMAHFLYMKWGYPILRCIGCGLGMTELAGSFDPESYYSESYFQGGTPDGYADYVGSERILRAEFRRQVQRLRRFGAKDGSLLEIGCAYGFFLLEASKHFRCTGIEVSKSAADFCRSRGLSVINGTGTREVSQEAPYDAVVMLDVIEHLRQPLEMLQTLSNLLKPGGSMMISTGDWNSPFARLMGKHWRLMTPPQHLFYFSRKTLISLLSKVGLEVVSCTRPWKLVPLKLVAYQVSNRLGLNLRSLDALSSFSLPVNLFDAITVVARKP